MQKLVLQPTIIISVVSAFISVIACIISVGQYQLQKKIYKDGNPKIDFNIEKGILYKEKNKVHYKIKINFTNLSNQATSILKANCILKLKCKDNVVVLKAKLLGEEASEININGNTAKSDYLNFYLNNDIYAKIEIKNKQLEIKDIHNYCICKEIIYMEEVIISEKNEKTD